MQKDSAPKFPNRNAFDTKTLLSKLKNQSILQNQYNTDANNN